MMAVRDVILASVLIFAFSIGLFVVYFASGTVVDEMIAISEINESSDAVEQFEAIKTTNSRLDYLIFGLFIGLSLGIIISGWYVGGNPIFMFIYFLVVMIGVVVSMMLANTWETVTQASIFGTTITAFPIANHLILYLPIYTTIIGFIGIVVMFAKPLSGK